VSDEDAATVQISPEDRDFAIRTMLGEEGSPEGMAGVASTILNRAQNGGYGGNSLKSVVLSHQTGPRGTVWQFEPWGSRSSELLSIPTNSPRYQQAANIFDGVASGEIPDFTGGATHFYAPVAQSDLGRPTPKWANGPGVGLGKTLFYSPAGSSHYLPPAVQAISDATTGSSSGSLSANATPPSQASFLTDFPDEATSQKTSAGAAFLRDFPPEGAAQPSTASPPPSPSSVSPAFLKDFPAEEPVAASTSPTSPSSLSAAAFSVVNNVIRATSEGVPVIGGLLNKADAWTDAALAPIGNRFFSPENQLTGSFWERYDKSLAHQNAEDAAFAAQHPIASTAANVAGSIVGSIPAITAAPAAFGVGGGSVFANALVGAGTAAAINAADSGIRNGFTLPNIASGAGTGAAAGFAAPFVGKGIGAGVNAISNAFTGAGPAASRVASYLTDLGLSPADVQAELTRLGPSATIADVDPALTTKAAALAAKGGASTSILKNAFVARAEGADNRVGQAIDAALGPKPDLTATGDAIYAKAQAAASPFYTAARANPTQMDATPVLNEIDARLASGAVGGTKTNLMKIKDFLTAEKADIPGPDGQRISMAIPKSDPHSLLAVRQELDDMIAKAPQNPDTTGAKNAVGALNDMRGRIDDVLKSDPNIAAGDAAFSQQMRLKDALNQGTELFTKGVRLEDFKRALATATPDEIDAMRPGARVAIGDAFDTARQGTLSAARSMFGKATANRAKLDALFPNAGDVFDKIAAEQTLRGNEQWIARNSKTAETTEALKEFDMHPPQSGSSILPAIAGYAIGGEPGAAAAVGAKSGFGAIKNALTEASRNRLMSDLASGLSATGPEQNMFLRRVGRAYNAAPATAAVTSAGNVGSNLLARSGAQRAQRVPANLLIGTPQ
jgi:hypothetical protein